MGKMQNHLASQNQITGLTERIREPRLSTLDSATIRGRGFLASVIVSIILQATGAPIYGLTRL